MAVMLANTQSSGSRVEMTDLLTNMSVFPVQTHLLWSTYE